MGRKRRDGATALKDVGLSRSVVMPRQKLGQMRVGALWWGTMARNCEICAARNLSEGRGSPRKKRLQRLLVHERIIAVCDEHASLASGARTIEELRGLFFEG